MLSQYDMRMEAKHKKASARPHSYKTPVGQYNYKKFVEKYSMTDTTELIRHVEELHRKSLNNHLLLRAIARLAAEERRSRKTESPKAHPNCTTQKAEG